MSSVSIPASNLLSYGTGAQTNRGPQSTPGVALASAGNQSLGTSDDEWKPVFSAAGPNAALVGFRSAISGQFVPVGRALAGITRAQYEQRQRQEADPIGNERGNRTPRPSRGGGGGAGGGGGGGGNLAIGAPGGNNASGQAPKFSGTAEARLEQLDQLLAGNAGLTQLNGVIRTDVQGALVAGLDLDAFTPELVARLSPTAAVNFLVWRDGEVVRYIDALFIADLENANIQNRMNATTALSYAALGIPVGRAGTGTDGVPATWLIKERGVWAIGVEGDMDIVTSEKTGAPGNLTPADLLARDWVLGATPTATISPLPDFTVRN